MKKHLYAIHRNKKIRVVWVAWKRQRHRSQIRTRAIETWTNQQMRGIGATTRDFDYIDLAVEIERRKVRRSIARFMPHEMINICRSWPPIMQVIRDHIDPAQ